MNTAAEQRVVAGRQGSALIVALVMVVFLAGLAAAIFSVSLARKNEVDVTTRQERALYLAEAGLTEAVLEIATAEKLKRPVADDIGTYSKPSSLERGKFWTSIVDNGDTTYRVSATGQAGGTTRTIEAVVGATGKSAFDYAIFAGNSADDPDYELRLSGIGVNADQVIGDVYSGNDVVIDDDASVVGDISSAGTITGAAGKEGISQPLPDILGMNYEVNHDFDVAALFSSATWQASIQGGSAWEMPETSPVHIFRKNPDDRLDEINGTVKDDYFLEDPYEALDGFTSWYNGRDGHVLSLADTADGATESGNDKIYYVDGNLWIHNKPWGRMMLSASGGARVTFVVKGNVYFSDDVLLDDNTTGGVAFIAIEDDNEPDSGNVYLGDPRYGTIDYLETFLYAENNFYDNNLDADGSAKVEIKGNMTAGNAVDIERDFIDPTDGSTIHSQLVVEFDERLSEDSLVLPGIPKPERPGVDGWGIVMWRELPEQ